VNKQKLLSIGIPTYNGTKFISKAITSAIDGIKKNKLEDEVEIIISDNASEDNTKEIVLGIIRDNPSIDIAYFANDTNIEFDRNVDMVVQHSSSKYVWFLSDDDYIINNGLKKVVDVLRENELDLLFVNYKNVIEVKRATKIYDNGAILWNDIKFKNGLISSNIINRDAWLSLTMSDYFDGLWIHMAYSLEVLSPIRKGKSGVIGEYVLAQEGDPRWGKNGTFIFTGFRLLDIFNKMLALGYSKQDKINADFVIKGGYPYNLIVAKAQGLIIDKSVLRQFIYYYKQYKSFWLIDLPVLLIPNILCKLYINTLFWAKKTLKMILGYK